MSCIQLSRHNEQKFGSLIFFVNIHKFDMLVYLFNMQVRNFTENSFSFITLDQGSPNFFTPQTGYGI